MYSDIRSTHTTANNDFACYDCNILGCIFPRYYCHIFVVIATLKAAAAAPPPSCEEQRTHRHTHIYTYTYIYIICASHHLVSVVIVANYRFITKSLSDRVPLWSLNELKRWNCR